MAIKKDEKTVSSNKYRFNFAEVIVIMVITLIFGIFVGSIGTIIRDDVKLFSYDKNANELVSTYNDIAENYYKDVDEDKLLEAGIKGMLYYLDDPYANYIEGEDAQEASETLEGEYVGLGVEISRDEDNVFTIVTVFKDGPADKCGIQEGDVLIEIDGVNIEGKDIYDLSELIKGAKGTEGTLTVLRENQELKMTFIRDSVVLSSVEGEIIKSDDKTIAYIQISTFAQNSASQFKEVYNDLIKEKPTHMVLDLRGNTGGYLVTVGEILSMFMDKGDVMYYTGIDKADNPLLSTTKKEIDLPVAILINGSSASASEVLASSLQDNLNSILIGTKSYGKGTVQKSATLGNGSSIKYTVEKWWTPNKNNIDGIGLMPTYEIKMNEEYYKNPSIETDNQLQEALRRVVEMN